MNINIEYAKIAASAARTAGMLIAKHLGKKHSISYKGRKNLVTDMDKKSEALIIGIIRGRYPDHSILSEESGLSGNTRSGYKWVIDPLDGTTNYAHGFNFFAVSIAIMHGGKALAGVVYDPVRDELFSAAKGNGAYLNRKRIRTSRINTIGNSLLSTGFPYKLGISMKKNLGYFAAFITRAQAIRRPGSAALDLCYVAAGRFDGFWEMELNPWDTAAGALIVEEAHGVVTDFNGNPFNPFMKQVVASNPGVHSQMLDILKKQASR
jgi:myo-inositol-1(or 4)-monophosphatase